MTSTKALARGQDTPLGMSGDFGEADTITPRAVLVQSQSVDKGEAGTFHFNDGRNVEALNVVVLHIGAARSMWTKDMTVQGPVCHSGDRRDALTRFPDFIAGDVNKIGQADEESTPVSCASCRFGETIKTYAAIDGEKCLAAYTLLLGDLDNNDEPFIYNVKGSQFSVVRSAIINGLKDGGAPWAKSFKFSTHKVEDPGKNYWALRITPSKDGFNEDSQALYASMSQAHGKRVAEPADPPPADGHGGIGN